MPNVVRDLNIVTSAAQFLATSFTDAGWLVYWQATGVSSGTATVGEVTLVPSFPNEPNVLVAPKDPVQSRTTSEIIIPAFAVEMIAEPREQQRLGLGEDLFFQRGTLQVEGFVKDRAEHFSVATLFRDWFREDASLPIYDFENTPSNPPLVNSGNEIVLFQNRALDRVEFLEKDAPPHLRYYINMEVDIFYAD